MDAPVLPASELDLNLARFRSGELRVANARIERGQTERRRSRWDQRPHRYAGWVVLGCAQFRSDGYQLGYQVSGRTDAVRPARPPHGTPPRPGRCSPGPLIPRFCGTSDRPCRKSSTAIFPVPGGLRPLSRLATCHWYHGVRWEVGGRSAAAPAAPSSFPPTQGPCGLFLPAWHHGVRLSCGC